MKNGKFSTGVFAVVLPSLLAGVAITCVGFADDARPCSGLKAAPCVKAVNAKDGCTRLKFGGPEDSCDGEVIEGPFTTVLIAGMQTNNMQEGYNFAICANRYECTEGASALRRLICRRVPRSMNYAAPSARHSGGLSV